MVSEGIIGSGLFTSLDGSIVLVIEFSFDKLLVIKLLIVAMITKLT